MENAKQKITDLILSRDTTNIELAYQLAESVGLLHWFENELVGLSLEDIQEFEKMGIDIVSTLIYEKKPANLLEKLSIEGLYDYFTEVPKAIQKFCNLKHLSLAENSITSIPMELCSLSKLETLLIDRNNIKFLPEEIQYLSQLKEIDLSGNPWENLEEDLNRIPATIEVLRLASLNLKIIPLSICRFAQLKELNLINNDLVELPTTFLGELKNLKIIHLSSNPWKNLEEDLNRVPANIEVLRLDFLHLKTIPPNICRFAQLKELSLFNNDLVELPRVFFGELKNLEIINLEYNERFKFLSEDIYLSSKLKELLLYRTQLNYLPENIRNLNQLKFVELSGNHFSNIIEELQKIKHLPIERLALHHLSLTQFPTLVFEFKHLKELNIAYNSIKTVSFLDAPPTFINNLEILSVYANPLEEIKGLNQFIHLKTLILCDGLARTLEIDKLIHLEWLSLPSNTPQLPFLANFPNLKYLRLSEDQASAVPYYQELLPNCKVDSF